jgi:hypothetical protein
LLNGWDGRRWRRGRTRDRCSGEKMALPSVVQTDYATLEMMQLCLPQRNRFVAVDNVVMDRVGWLNEEGVNNEPGRSGLESPGRENNSRGRGKERAFLPQNSQISGDNQDRFYLHQFPSEVHRRSRTDVGWRWTVNNLETSKPQPERTFSRTDASY